MEKHYSIGKYDDHLLIEDVKIEKDFDFIILVNCRPEMGPGDDMFDIYLNYCNDMRAWCIDNKIEIRVYDYNHVWISAHMFFCFKSENEMTAFSIRWQ